VLPGAIVIDFLEPDLAADGPPEWGVAGLVVLVMWRTENILRVLCAGAAGVVPFRAIV